MAKDLNHLAGQLNKGGVSETVVNLVRRLPKAEKSK